MKAGTITYLYDGACRVCSTEVDRLRRRDAAGKLRLVDISHPSFDAAAKADMVGFYTATDADYGSWSRDFNMHFGYWERGIGPFDRESMLERMNVKVHERLGLPDRPVRVADLGCGAGASARSLVRRRANARVSAVTNVPAQIARGVRLGTPDAIEFVLADYRDTGLAAGAYDGVYAIESACHAPGAAKRGVVEEAYRLLRPGGRLAIADCFVKRPLPRFLVPVYRRWCESWFVPEMPRVDAMRSALEDAGFADVEFTEISWRVAPTVGHVPWVAGRYLVAELLRGRLTAWRRRHAVASLLSIVLGLARGSIGYYIVAARKPS